MLLKFLLLALHVHHLLIFGCYATTETHLLWLLILTILGSSSIDC
jgi:hypothetical protein